MKNLDFKDFMFIYFVALVGAFLLAFIISAFN